jgi:hypothetical protein
MELEKYVRKLAKRTDILNQFAAAKELKSIRFFINEIDLSKIQNSFLSYLYLYYNLYQDIYTDKVSSKVTDDEIYEDAYLYYKSKVSDKVIKKPKGKKQLDGVFSKDNKINFPKIEVN